MAEGHTRVHHTPRPPARHPSPPDRSGTEHVRCQTWTEPSQSAQGLYWRSLTGYGRCTCACDNQNAVDIFAVPGWLLQVLPTSLH